jgi:hypothetical protein
MDRVVLDGQGAGGLVHDHGGELVERGAEHRRVGAGVAHGGEARLGQGVVNDEYVHGGQPTVLLSRLAV